MWSIPKSDPKQRVVAIKDRQGTWVSWYGGSTFVANSSSAAAQNQRDDEVRAPMTAKVLNVEVAVGSTVEEGDLLLVLEAMKMEYRLTAPRSGEVARLACEVGQLVELGALLVSFDG